MASKRAVQFTPFAALRGYYEMIREKERVRVPHHILAEDGAELLSRKMAQVKKGMLLEVIHYCDGEYIRTTGLVSAVDSMAERLTIVKTEIAFSDIYDVRGNGIAEDFI